MNELLLTENWFFLGRIHNFFRIRRSEAHQLTPKRNSVSVLGVRSASFSITRQSKLEAAGCTRALFIHDPKLATWTMLLLHTTLASLSQYNTNPSLDASLRNCFRRFNYFKVTYDIGVPIPTKNAAPHPHISNLARSLGSGKSR